MAEIIDLEFYRKFRIILPVREQTLRKNKPFGVSYTPPRRYFRRRKSDPESKVTKED